MGKTLNNHDDILVVDDNEVILSLVAEVAENNGYHVRTTHSAEEFFSAYDEKQPDLMLIDIVMPDMDGLEMIKRLSELDSQVPLAIMSGYDYVDDRGIKLLAKRLNLKRFLRKPFDISELKELFSSSLPSTH